jgi:polyisoprenoid-binding protein YceI
MKILTTAICVMMMFASFAQSFKVDTENTKVSYNFVKEKVTGNVEGFEATINLDFSDISKSTINGSVDATTLTSGNGMRDKHLQAKDYFHTKEFPKMKFESSSFEKTDGGYLVKGKMTIKDVSQEVTINFTHADNMINGKCVIYTNDFNIAEKKDREESKVLIKFDVAVK